MKKLRADFPILSWQVNGHPLCYVDNAAMAQMPQPVIDAIARFYAESNANVHRAACTLGEEATARFERARERVSTFIGAQSDEIVFTSGTTDGINLVADAWGRANVQVGDEIVITELEHHSNLLPWQRLCQQVGATLKQERNGTGKPTCQRFQSTPGFHLYCVAAGPSEHVPESVDHRHPRTRRRITRAAARSEVGVEGSHPRQDLQNRTDSLCLRSV